MNVMSGYSLVAIMAGWLLPVTALYAGTASQDVKFTATFIAGSCDITAPSSVAFNNGASVMRDSIAEGKESVNITLNLSNCNGYFLAPNISVSGDTVDIQSKRYFMDSSSTTKGYGILLSTLGNAAWSANSNIAQNKVINAKSWPKEGTEQVTTLNGNLALTAKLVCGSCTAGPNLHGGDFKSTVTFTFKYK